MVPGCLYSCVCVCGWEGHGACSCQILVSVSLSVEKFTYIFATSFSKFATTITTLQPPCYCYSVLVIICNIICTSTGLEVKNGVKWPSELGAWGWGWPSVPLVAACDRCCRPTHLVMDTLHTSDVPSPHSHQARHQSSYFQWIDSAL